MSQQWCKIKKDTNR